METEQNKRWPHVEDAEIQPGEWGKPHRYWLWGLLYGEHGLLNGMQFGDKPEQAKKSDLVGAYAQYLVSQTDSNVPTPFMQSSDREVSDLLTTLKEMAFWKGDQGIESQAQNLVRRYERSSDILEGASIGINHEGTLNGHNLTPNHVRIIIVPGEKTTLEDIVEGIKKEPELVSNNGGSVPQIEVGYHEGMGKTGIFYTIPYPVGDRIKKIADWLEDNGMNKNRLAIVRDWGESEFASMEKTNRPGAARKEVLQPIILPTPIQPASLPRVRPDPAANGSNGVVHDEEADVSHRIPTIITLPNGVAHDDPAPVPPEPATVVLPAVVTGAPTELDPAPGDVADDDERLLNPGDVADDDERLPNPGDVADDDERLPNPGDVADDDERLPNPGDVADDDERLLNPGDVADDDERLPNPGDAADDDERLLNPGDAADDDERLPNPGDVADDNERLPNPGDFEDSEAELGAGLNGLANIENTFSIFRYGYGEPEDIGKPQIITGTVNELVEEEIETLAGTRIVKRHLPDPDQEIGDEQASVLITLMAGLNGHSARLSGKIIKTAKGFEEKLTLRFYGKIDLDLLLDTLNGLDGQQVSGRTVAKFDGREYIELDIGNEKAKEIFAAAKQRKIEIQNEGRFP